MTGTTGTGFSMSPQGLPETPEEGMYARGVQQAASVKGEDHNNMFSSRGAGAPTHLTHRPVNQHKVSA